MRKVTKATIVGRGAAVLVAAATAFAVQAQDTDALAKRLIELRSEVEDLNQELDLLKQGHRAQMQGLAQQKAELEANRSRLETQVRQLEQQREEYLAEAAAAGVDNDNLLPVLLRALDDLRGHLGQSLPFKRDERLGELDEIRRQLETGAIPANRGANRLWAFYEDEIRLTRENGLYSQTVELGGERLLADVAKLGTVMMLFQTEDQRYGEVVRHNGEWRFQVVEGADEIETIRNLFDSLEKQIRQGYFRLPNTLAGRIDGGAS